MANAAQLVRLLSEVTGEPLPTVSDQDRKLVKAGLRTLRGRGWNAGRMTARDAAHLLTSLLAARRSSKAAETVEQYVLTRPDLRRSSDGLYAGTGIDELASLPSLHSFVDALDVLIRSAGRGSLRALCSQENQIPRIEVFAFAGSTYGRIRLSGLASGLTANVEYVPINEIRSSRSSEMSQSGDLQQSRRITERTILAVANLFAEESHDDHA